MCRDVRHTDGKRCPPALLHALQRMNAVYSIDEAATLRKSHANPAITVSP